jgi:hypothetical protein
MRRDAMRKALLASLMVLGSLSPARAVEFSIDGYADLRVIVPSNQVGWLDGGLGKLRYGSEQNSPEFRVAEVVGQGVAQITPGLMAMAVVRYSPEQRTFFDVLEAFVRWRPVSTTPVRFSLEAGAFFPPISLENTEIGWTSPWTLTPSAINSWVGEELRSIGAEATVEWRRSTGTASIYGALYGWNDPTGVLLNRRGWALHDQWTGLIDRPRLPDIYALTRRPPEPVPSRTWEFIEIDKRVGWYAGASWDEIGIGHLDILYYNNAADPTAEIEENDIDTYSWKTEFWNVGLRTEIGPVTLLAQGMRGDTFFHPSETFWSDTWFESAYLLAGWNINEDWRIAGRAEVFSTNEKRPGTGLPLSEHGHAFTAAINYLPNDWLRVTGEYIHVESYRRQRTRGGLPPDASEDQFQLSLRFYLP